MQQVVSGTKMGRIPKSERASLHVRRDTRERVKRILNILAGERADSTLTIEDAVKAMADCFERAREK